MVNQLSPTGRFEKIMFATDGSDYGADAEAVALAMTEQCGGALLITSVVITNPAAEAAAPEVIQTTEQETGALVRRIYGLAVQRGIAAETVVRRGSDPVAELVAAADEHRADVLVMGRRAGRGRMRRWLGDSTSKAVGSAKCSVLVVPDGATMWCKRILLATDGSRFSDAAAVAAGKIALLCRLPVTVLSVIRESFSEERAAEADETVTRVHAHLRSQHIDVDKLVVHGEPETVIGEVAVARDADLIVMGTHGRTGWERVIVGSVTDSVIGASTLPVLAVKL